MSGAPGATGRLRNNMKSQKDKPRKYFGTDGIRAHVGEEPMTPEFVLKLGWAAGKVFSDYGDKVVIGKDTRLSGYLFESVLEAGVSSAGLDIHLTGPLPTPAISYLTRTLNAAGGIVISASHNPFHDNGVKLLASDGGKLPVERELEVEYWLDQPLKVVEPGRLGKAYRVNDSKGRYIEYCKGTTRHQFNLNGVRVAMDCANGAAYAVAPKVFSELGAEVRVINAEPDGENINLNCGALHIDALREVMGDADIGVSLDGDGDRLSILDRDGVAYDGDDLLMLILNHRLQSKTFTGGVVGTQMNNLGLEQAIREKGIDYVRVPVGDPFVLQELKDRSWVLGGEPSGHIMCTDKMITADAIVAALEVCEAVKDNNFDLSAVRKMMRKRPTKMVNVKCRNGEFDDHRKRLEPLFDEARKALGDDGRIVVRPSGTEPYVRIMVESNAPETSDEWATRLSDAVDKAVNGG